MNPNKYQIGADVVCETILEHFGSDAQRLKTIEELSECIHRLAKNLIEKQSAKECSDETIEEIADATIMLRQMRLLHGHDLVDRVIERKLDRTISAVAFTVARRGGEV
jgi:hypothetical protein